MLSFNLSPTAVLLATMCNGAHCLRLQLGAQPVLVMYMFSVALRTELRSNVNPVGLVMFSSTSVQPIPVVPVRRS